MDTLKLHELDSIVYQQIQAEKKQKELEHIVYYEGMEKGADMMMRAVRNYLLDEKKGGKTDA